MNTLLWVISAILVVVGLVGSVVPVIPGVVLIFAGALLGAWIDQFQLVSMWTVGVLAFLMVLAWVLDYLAGLLGAKKAGASTLSVVGAAIGTIAGLFMGLVGVLFMPFVGAVIGEYISRGNEQGAIKVGFATWLGMIVGLLAKVVIAFMMVGIYLVALIVK